jgi:hypothetical protein
MVAFNLRKFTNPDLLKTIAPGRLIAFLSPWREYLAKRGLPLSGNGRSEIDCDALAHILMDPDASVPKDMVDALYYVHETASDEDMDALLDLAKTRTVEIEHDPQTTVADVAIQMWLAAPDILREHHAEAIAFRQKNFLYYRGAHGDKRAFPKVDDDLRRQLEMALDDWFDDHKRGRGCRVFFFPHGKKVWILVRHGQPMRREASQGEDGRSSTEFYRPQQHDVLIYDTASDEMSVHANTKGEIKLYLACFGRLLFGAMKTISRRRISSVWTRSSTMARTHCCARTLRGWMTSGSSNTAAIGAANIKSLRFGRPPTFSPHSRRGASGLGWVDG